MKKGAATPGAACADIGKVLRKHRQQRRISIRQLARDSGVSAAMISRIEQGRTSSSFTTLWRLLNVFGMTFADFFGSRRSAEGSPVIRRAEMKLLRGIGHGLKARLVNSGSDRQIQMFHEEYAPGGSTGTELLSHPSVEVGMCVEGQLNLEVAGTVHAVSAGDGWFFDSRLPHRFSNVSRRRAVLISANTPGVL